MTSGQALIDSGVGCYMFGSGNRTKAQMMTALLKAWPEIQRMSEDEQRPFIYVLHADGKLERLYPAPERKPASRRVRGRRDEDVADAP